jgi:hypothetical protein
MKFLRLLLFVLTAGILFTSCQKELSAETGSAIGTIAKDASGNCTPATPSGAYKKDTALNATNFVDIQLDITNVGIYIVTTDTVNGYYFRATGVTPLPGVNIIRLVGFGKPIVAGTNLFKVKFNTDVCEFAVNVTGTTGGGGTNAVFTLGTTASACTGFTLGTGTYTPGTGLSATNTVTLNVNVTTPGAYTLNATTTAATGVTFAATGTFPAGTSGAATIILTAQPAPGNTGTSPTNTVAIPSASYDVTAGGTTCSFTVPFNAPPPPATYTVTCGGITSAGTYTATVPLTNNETVTIQVSATGAGLYNITTDVQNGVKFVGSGSLVLGNNTVILRAVAPNNTPTTANTFTYTITGSTCTFPIVFGAAPLGVFRAKIDGVLIDFNANDNASATYFPGSPANSDLIISGDAATVPISLDLEIDKSLAIPASAVGAATYLNTLAASLAGQYFLGADYTDASSAHWGPKGVVVFPPEVPDNFTIVITQITATRVIGTFTGTIRDSFGAGTNTKTVTEGVFNVPIL